MGFRGRSELTVGTGGIRTRYHGDMYDSAWRKGKDERNHLYFNRLSSKLSGTALIDYYRLKFILRRFSVFVNRSQNYQNQIIYF